MFAAHLNRMIILFAAEAEDVLFRNVVFVSDTLNE